MKNRYKDLEMNILSCLVQEPKLMDELFLEDDDFVNYRRFWNFLKSFYKKYGTFDYVLMNNVCNNSYKFSTYVEQLTDATLYLNKQQFINYQNALLDLKKETTKNNWITDKCFKLANDLYVKNISVEDFRLMINKVYEQADEIFREE